MSASLRNYHRTACRRMMRVATANGHTMSKFAHATEHPVSTAVCKKCRLIIQLHRDSGDEIGAALGNDCVGHADLVKVYR